MEQSPLRTQPNTDYQTLSPKRRPPPPSTDPASAAAAGAEAVETPAVTPAPKPARQPRRVIHFSDGVIEEYSTDEEEEAAKKAEQEAEAEARRKREQQSLVDPKTLRWLPWAMYYGWFAGSALVRYCDVIGEKLAWGLGITSPKYYYELEEFKRMKEEEEEARKQMDVETQGWRPEGGRAAGDKPIELDPTKLESNG